MTKRKSKPSRADAPLESRAAEALTVLWMLSALTALLCELGLLAVHWYLQIHAEDQYVAALYFLLWLTALVVGTMTLVLVPIVLKMRVQPPPPSVTIVAAAIGAVPWVMLLIS